MQLHEALALVGPIVPVFNADFQVWEFESPHFPYLNIHGESADEIITKYPQYLAIHLDDLQHGRVANFIMQATPGTWGGKREGAGRPIGTKKTPKTRISLPCALATVLKRYGDYPFIVQETPQGLKVIFKAEGTAHAKPERRRKR